MSCGARHILGVPQDAAPHGSTHEPCGSAFCSSLGLRQPPCGSICHLTFANGEEIEEGNATVASSWIPQPSSPRRCRLYPGTAPDAEEGAGALLEGVALRWLRRLRRDSALWLDYLLEASCGDGSVPPVEGVGGVNGERRVEKLRVDFSALSGSGRGAAQMEQRR